MPLRQNLSPYLKLKKRAVRTISSSDFLAHTNPLFYSNQLLKVTDLYYYFVGIFMYQLNKQELPSVFSNLFVQNQEIHSYPTRQVHNFHISPVRSILALKTFTYTGPSFWNTLDSDIIQSPSLFSFKRRLKRFLLQPYV